MASLLDTIRQNSGAMATQKQGVEDQTQQTAALLRAKRGRAGVAPQVGMSNLGEQQAVANTNAVMQNQVAPQAAMQDVATTQAARADAQSASLAKSEIAQGRQFNAIENKLRTKQALDAFERDKASLDLDKNRAQVNQFTQSLRLDNQKYISDLQREGAKARLDDETSFNEALAREVFDDNEALLKSQQKNAAILGSDDRAFQKQLAQMGVDESWSMFRANQKAAQDRGKWQAIGSILSAGVGAARAASTGGTDSGAVAGSQQSDYSSLPDSYGTGGSRADYERLK